jgi:hypothetical protein
LSPELHQRFIGWLDPQDLNRFSQTSRYSRALVVGHSTLKETLDSAQRANVAVDRLGKEELDNRLPESIFSDFIPHLAHIDEKPGNDVVRLFASAPDDVFAKVFKKAAPRWDEFTEFAQDTFLTRATVIVDPATRTQALGEIGRFAGFRGLTPRQQLNWANAFASLSAFRREQVLQWSMYLDNARGLTDEARGVIYQAVSGLPDSERKRSALRVLEQAAAK